MGEASKLTEGDGIPRGIMHQLKVAIRAGKAPGPVDGATHGDPCDICGAVAHIRAKDPAIIPEFIPSESAYENECNYFKAWAAFRIEPLQHDAAIHTGESPQGDLKLTGPRRTWESDQDE